MEFYYRLAKTNVLISFAVTVGFLRTLLIFVTIKCLKCFEVMLQTSVCSSNQKFMLLAVDCGSPTASTGYIPGTPDMTTEGGTASVSCDTANGYTGTAASITCQADGTWTAYSGCSGMQVYC